MHSLHTDSTSPNQQPRSKTDPTLLRRTHIPCHRRICPNLSASSSRGKSSKRYRKYPRLIFPIIRFLFVGIYPNRFPAITPSGLAFCISGDFLLLLFNHSKIEQYSHTNKIHYSYQSISFIIKETAPPPTHTRTIPPISHFLPFPLFSIPTPNLQSPNPNPITVQ